MYKPNKKYYVYRINEFIFSIIILFYYCFSGTPLLNVTPLHDPVEDLRTKSSSVWAEVSSLMSPEVPVEKGHRATGSQRRIYNVLLCLSDGYYSIKNIPTSIF